ncbi:MAG: hypothetical protein VST67_04560, partial [Nitrospirota bacterium]|nr:hypothetical protein [Nitrospirota bacterium]
MPLSSGQLDRIVNAEEGDPFAILGPHYETNGHSECLHIRAFLPEAAEAVCLVDDPAATPLPMTLLSSEGFFEVVLPKKTPIPSYTFRLTTTQGTVLERHDPYAFSPI